MAQDAMRFTLCGKTWNLKRPVRLALNGDTCDGLCDFNTRTLSVRKAVSGLLELWTLLHEMRHATDERLKEDFVDQESCDQADLLWRLGYRKLTRQQRKQLGIE